MTIFSPPALIAFRITGRDNWLSPVDLRLAGLRMSRLLGAHNFQVGRRSGASANDIEIPLIDISNGDMRASWMQHSLKAGPNDQVIQILVSGVDYFSESIPVGDWPVIRSILTYARVRFNPTALWYGPDCDEGFVMREIQQFHLDALDMEFSANGRVDSFEYNDGIVHATSAAQIDAEHHRHPSCSCCGSPMNFVGIHEADSDQLEMFSCKSCGERATVSSGAQDYALWYGRNSSIGHLGPVTWAVYPADEKDDADYDVGDWTAPGPGSDIEASHAAA